MSRVVAARGPLPKKMRGGRLVFIGEWKKLRVIFDFGVVVDGLEFTATV